MDKICATLDVYGTIAGLVAKTGQFHFLAKVTFPLDLTYQTFGVFWYKTQTTPNKVISAAFNDSRKIYLAKQYFVNTVTFF